MATLEAHKKIGKATIHLGNSNTIAVADANASVVCPDGSE